ncbi:MAG TPA: OsmC family protein [Acetobacteraceae bacterium]|nr:OsmC family protein [Acetobacteraceae bacterium]
MNAEQLRTAQAPLKQRYRETPEAAMVEARGEASLDPADVACAVRAWQGDVRAGLHPATGGSGEQACSADMLLQALVACAGVTLRAVATAMGVTVRGGRVVAAGHWDARGTLGVDRAAPVGLTDITLTFDVDCDADAAKLERMIATTERYCVILQTLKHPPAVSIARPAGQAAG